MLLDRMEDAGLSLSITHAGKLRVAGIRNDKQREFIRAHKQRVIVSLRLRPIAEKHGHDLGDLMSWYKNDIEDLAGKSDGDLEFSVARGLSILLVELLYKPVPHCVKCIDCKHFVRSSHPHLGRCDAGVNQTAPAGFWDTHLRGCDKYREAIA